MKNKKEKLSFNNIYTPLSVAKEEIQRRWNDKELRKKVEDFLGGDVPEIFKDGPKAVLVRHIASPNHELFYFMDLVKHLGIDYRCVEFTKDKFVASNEDKYYLGKLCIFNGLGKHFGEKIDRKKIIEIKESEGKKLCDIETLWGESLVDFHHRLLFSVFPENKEKMFDISEWFFRNGPSSKEFYKYYLALFICHGVIFENFLTKDKTNKNDFTKKIVTPVLRELKNIFGVSPLIIPVSSIECEADMYWLCYPTIIDKLHKIKK